MKTVLSLLFAILVATVFAAFAHPAESPAAAPFGDTYHWRPMDYGGFGLYRNHNIIGWSSKGRYFELTAAGWKAGAVPADAPALPDAKPARVEPLSYADAYYTAKKYNLALIVFCNVPDRVVDTKENPCPSIVCRDDSFEFIGVMVGVPDGAGRFDRVLLPNYPTDTQIRAATKPKPAVMIAPQPSIWAGQWSYGSECRT